MKKISKWLGILKMNLVEFLKHPIQYCKNYFKEFKEASTEEKVKKILMTIAGIVALYYMFVVVMAVIVSFVVIAGFIGSVPDGDDLRRMQNIFRDRHGREAENMDELYRGIY